MQVKVPQDVQRADQILGPLTVKQLAILIGGGLLGWIFYTSLKPQFGIPLTILVSSIALAFAFVRIQTWTFAIYLKSTILFVLKPKTRTWQKMADSVTLPIDEIMKIKFEKARLAKKVAVKASKIEDVDKMAQLLDEHGGMKQKLTDIEAVDRAEDESLLQTAYFGAEHNPEKEQEIVNQAINEHQKQ
jgi:hypothetical protein